MGSAAPRSRAGDDLDEQRLRNLRGEHVSEAAVRVPDPDPDRVVGGAPKARRSLALSVVPGK